MKVLLVGRGWPAWNHTCALPDFDGTVNLLVLAPIGSEPGNDFEAFEVIVFKNGASLHHRRR